MAELVVKLVNGELAGKTMQSLTKEVNAAATAFKKAEVGTQEWVNAHAKLEHAKKLQGDLKKQIDATSGASNSLKTAFGGILGQIPGFGALSQALGAMRGGVGGLTSGFGMLRGAIIATGFGALIIAVTSIVGWFAKTEKGANMLSGAFKGMGAVLDTLMNRLWNIGTTLKELFSDPIKFFKNLGNDIKQAATEGYDLVQVFDDIEDRQREMEVSAKQADNMVDQLMLQARNVGKTYQERIDLLNQADQITRNSYAEQLKLSEEYLKAVEREVALAEKGGTMGDELADKRKNAQLAYLDLKGQEIQVEEKIANRREQILGKQEKEKEKADANKQKADEKEAKDLEASLKQLEDMRVQAIRDSQEQEIAETNLKFQRLLEESTLQGEQRLELEKLIEETRAQEIQAIKDKYAAEERAKKKKLEADNASEDEKAKKKREDDAKKDVELQRTVADAKMSLASTALGATVQLLGEDEKARKKNADAIKAFTIAQIITDTEREIAGYFANPASTATLGVVGGIKAAIAIIRAGLAIQRVSSQKFALGGVADGVLHGPSHAQGGIPINVEGDEIIMTKGVYRNPGLRSMASAINVAGGGRSFASGGPTNPFDQGGSASSSSSAAASTIGFDPISQLREAILAQTEAINARIDRIQVVNNLQDTEKGLRTLNTLRDEADV
jgi:hypothetical protein